jgi:hypothetical protein
MTEVSGSWILWEEVSGNWILWEEVLLVGEIAEWG